MRALGGGVVSSALPPPTSRRGAQRCTAWGSAPPSADAGLEAVLALAHLQDSRPASGQAPETRRPPSEALGRLAQPRPDPLDDVSGAELQAEDFPFSPKIGAPWCLDVGEELYKHEQASDALAEKWRKKKTGILGKCCINVAAATEEDASVRICKHCKTTLCVNCWVHPCKARQERWKHLSLEDRVGEMEESGVLSGWESRAMAQRVGAVHDRLHGKAKSHRPRSPSSRSFVPCSLSGTGTSWATSLGDTWGTVEGHKSDLSAIFSSEKTFLRLTSPRCYGPSPEPPHLPCMRKQLPRVEDFEWYMVCHEPAGRCGPAAAPTRCRACRSVVSAAEWSMPCRMRLDAWEAMDLSEKINQLERRGKVSQWQAKAMLRCAQPVFSRLCGDAFDPSALPSPRVDLGRSTALAL